VSADPQWLRSEAAWEFETPEAASAWVSTRTTDVQPHLQRERGRERKSERPAASSFSRVSVEGIRHVLSMHWAGYLPASVSDHRLGVPVTVDDGMPNNDPGHAERRSRVCQTTTLAMPNDDPVYAKQRPWPCRTTIPGMSNDDPGYVERRSRVCRTTIPGMPNDDPGYAERRSRMPNDDPGHSLQRPWAFLAPSSSFSLNGVGSYTESH
jgi:hypothetical protein